MSQEYIVDQSFRILGVRCPLLWFPVSLVSECTDHLSTQSGTWVQKMKIYVDKADGREEFSRLL